MSRLKGRYRSLWSVVYVRSEHMNCGNIEERQFIHLGGFGGWAGHRLLLRGEELILKGPVRIVPGDEDGVEEGCSH